MAQSSNAKFTFWQTIIVAIIGAIVSITTVMINKSIDQPVSEKEFDSTVKQSINSYLSSDETKNQIQVQVNSVSERIPVGTIVASIFDYQTFLAVQNLSFTTNMREAIWVPCDGREVDGSKFDQFKSNVPDLRGLFLRNVNEYNTTFEGVDPVRNEQKNPQNKRLGEYQPDAIRNIKGSFLASNPNQAGIPDPNNKGAFTSKTYNFGGDKNEWGPNNANIQFVFDASKSTGTRVGLENRPKNRTVMYFIKIN